MKYSNNKLLYCLVFISLIAVGCQSTSSTPTPTSGSGTLTIALTQNITTESASFKVIVYQGNSAVTSGEVASVSLSSSKEVSFSLPNGIYTVEAFVDANSNQTADDTEYYAKEDSITLTDNTITKPLSPNLKKTLWGPNKLSGFVIGQSTYNTYIGLYTEDFTTNQNASNQGQVIGKNLSLANFSFKVKNGTYFLGAFSDVNSNGIFDSSDNYGLFNWDGNGTATAEAITINNHDSTSNSFVVYIGKTPIANTIAWDKTTIEANLGDVISAGTALSLDSLGKAFVSYFNGSSYTLKNATNSTGVWVKATADPIKYTGRKNSIAVNSSGKVYICYYDYSIGKTEIKCTTNASGAWVSTTIDGSVGSTLETTAIAIDTNDKVHISYYDSANGNLQYASNKTGNWVVTTLDSSGDVGQGSSIATDASNNVHISYYDATNGDLKYATNASSSWTISTIDSPNNVGAVTSIAIDSNSKAHVAYRDSTNKALKYITNKSGSWQSTTIDANQESGGFCSLAIDLNNKAHVSYYYYNPNTLKALLKYATNLSGSWATNTVDDSTFNAYVPLVGSDNSIKVDNTGKVFISYYYNPTQASSKIMVAVSK